LSAGEFYDTSFGWNLNYVNIANLNTLGMGLIARTVFVLRKYTCFRDKQRQAHERMPLKRLSSAMTTYSFTQGIIPNNEQFGQA